MSKMRKPEMDVIRFKEADVIVASGATANTLKWSGFGDGITGNGVVEYGGRSYTMDSESSYNSLLEALSAIGVTGDTHVEWQDGTSNRTLSFILQKEYGSGVSSDTWNETYYFDGSILRRMQ